MEETVNNLQIVHERIKAACERAGRTPDQVKLIAVSKNFPAEHIIPVYKAGQRSFGENRVQELLKKKVQMPGDIEWHLIGTLQRNKVKDIIDQVTLIHSVNSVELAREISKLAVKKNIKVNILLQVNVSGEISKHGFNPEEIFTAFKEIRALAGIKIKGLMTMAPIAENTEDVRPVFRGLFKLARKLEAENPGIVLPELSMGMSDDFEIAVEEGATLVRVGSRIFGQRIYEEGKQ